VNSPVCFSVQTFRQLILRCITHLDAGPLPTSTYSIRRPQVWFIQGDADDVTVLYRRFETYIPSNETVRPCSRFLHLCMICHLWAIYKFPPSVVGRLILGIYTVNRSQIRACRNWEAEHYNSVLEIMKPLSLVSFLVIHQSEPDIYNGFSPPFICRTDM
jgi:hypothetical protein